MAEEVRDTSGEATAAASERLSGPSLTLSVTSLTLSVTSIDTALPAPLVVDSRNCREPTRLGMSDLLNAQSQMAISVTPSKAQRTLEREDKGGRMGEVGSQEHLHTRQEREGPASLTPPRIYRSLEERLLIHW